MGLLTKLTTPPAIVDSIRRYGLSPVGVPITMGDCPTRGLIKGQPVVLAGTSNYLGLTFDPTCIDAAVAATRRYGTGTTGSRMANGTYELHERLEARLAEFFGASSAMVFSTGYQANLGMIAGLAGPDDVVLLDADSHASIYDGARLSGAQVYRFRHNDVAALARRLERIGDRAANTLVVVEGLYSMMGDRAPLAEIVEVVEAAGAVLLVDEAHSMGVLGEHGRGRAEEEGVLDRVDFVVGTFSKSLGAIGGYCVSGRHSLEPVRPAARAYMFTASPSPGAVASVTAALDVVASRPNLRHRLSATADRVHAALVGLGLEVGVSPGPIIPVRLADQSQAVDAWHALLAAGVYVNLVVPPATPGNFALLRCSLSAAHTDADLDQVEAGFAKVAALTLAKRANGHSKGV